MAYHQTIIRKCWKDMINNEKILEDFNRETTVVDEIKQGNSRCLGTYAERETTGSYRQ
jgi:hypothetical protein